MMENLNVKWDVNQLFKWNTKLIWNIEWNVKQNIKWDMKLKW